MSFFVAWYRSTGFIFYTVSFHDNIFPFHLRYFNILSFPVDVVDNIPGSVPHYFPLLNRKKKICEL
jgi:hypothetical protein